MDTKIMKKILNEMSKYPANKNIKELSVEGLSRDVVMSYCSFMKSIGMIDVFVHTVSDSREIDEFRVLGITSHGKAFLENGVVI